MNIKTLAPKLLQKINAYHLPHGQIYRYAIVYLAVGCGS